jgi:2-polyprenyl-3-methyl-5-hydroxy-6-metoxy-1,4-benzoquinol methylase
MNTISAWGEIFSTKRSDGEKGDGCPYFDNRHCPRFCVDSLIYRNKENNLALGKCPVFHNSYVLFSDNRKVLQNYYNKNNLKEYCAYYEPFRKKRFSELFRLESMKKFSGKAALDIGCGFGWCLEQLEQLGWQRLVGIDYSLAGRLAADKGFKIMVNKFTPELELNEKFDLIILSNVLEHLWRPLDCLLWVKNHLSRNGRLLLVIPTADGFAMRTFHSFIKLFPSSADKVVKDLYQTETTMGHLVLYSTAGIIELCRMAGFSILEQHFSPIIDAGSIKKRMLIDSENLSIISGIKAFVLKFILLLANWTKRQDELSLILIPVEEKQG